MPEPRYTDLETLKSSYLDQRGDLDDDWLSLLLGSAENLFERATGRSFAPDPPLDSSGGDSAPPVLRRLSSGGKDAHGGEQALIPVPDLREADAVTVAGAAVTAASSPGVYPLDGYELERQRSDEPAWALRIPRTLLHARDADGDLVVSGRWGWLSPPADAVDAVYLMAARATRERDAAFAETIETDTGSVITYLRSLPPRAWMAYTLLRHPVA